MSWGSPSPSEAAEMYSYYKHKYENAANKKRASEKLEQSYVEQKKAAVSQLNSVTSQKKNLEKRLEEIEKIIKMLEGNGGWFAANVPEAIEKARTKLREADNSYKSSIRAVGGTAVASLESAFAIKTVIEDANSANALAEFKNEYNRVKQEITDLEAKITSLSNSISSLSSLIKTCNEAQASLKTAMRSYAYDMNHYHGFMY